MAASSPITIGWTLTRRYGWVVAIGGLVGGLVAGSVALLTPKQWNATQQLIVRDELLGDRGRTGRFASLDDMKTLEETVRTVVRSRRVIGAALAQLDPPASHPPDTWPDDEFVEDFRSKVSVTAPNGAEFGHTEVIQLHVTERSPERAVEVIKSLIVALGRELTALRQTRLIGIEKELARSLDAADRSLQEASLELASIEKQVGIDLAELRSMTDTNGSEGPLARQLGQTRQDRVQLEQRAGELQTHLQHLQRLLNAPEKIVSTPESLLAIHPELRRLKESIIDSAVTLAQLRSQYDVQHPRVIAAALADRQLAAELQVQLQSAFHGTELELELIQTRQTQLDDVEQRLSERMLVLAEQRVAYAELAHRVEQRKTHRALIEAEWSDVKAALGEMQGAEIASPLGTPMADPRPSGPGRTTVALAGVAGGIALALAGIALIIDPKSMFNPTETSESNTPLRSSRPQDPLTDLRQRMTHPLAMPTELIPTWTEPTESITETQAFDFANPRQPTAALNPDDANSFAHQPRSTPLPSDAQPRPETVPPASPQPLWTQDPNGEHRARLRNAPPLTSSLSTAANPIAALPPTPEMAPSLQPPPPQTPDSNKTHSTEPPPSHALAQPTDPTATHSSALPEQAGLADADREAEKWRALVELSDEIAELKRSIERRRAAALAEELARYDSTRSH